MTSKLEPTDIDPNRDALAIVRGVVVIDEDAFGVVPGMTGSDEHGRRNSFSGGDGERGRSAEAELARREFDSHYRKAVGAGVADAESYSSRVPDRSRGLLESSTRQADRLRNERAPRGFAGR